MEQLSLFYFESSFLSDFLWFKHIFFHDLWIVLFSAHQVLVEDFMVRDLHVLTLQSTYQDLLTYLQRYNLRSMPLVDSTGLWTISNLDVKFYTDIYLLYTYAKCSIRNRYKIIFSHRKIFENEYFLRKQYFLSETYSFIEQSVYHFVDFLERFVHFIEVNGVCKTESVGFISFQQNLWYCWVLFNVMNLKNCLKLNLNEQQMIDLI